MDFLKKCCLFLNDSQQTARFQRMCGIILDIQSPKVNRNGQYNCNCKFWSAKDESLNSNEKACYCISNKKVSSNGHTNGYVVNNIGENGRCQQISPGVDLNSNERIASTVRFKITNRKYLYFFKFVSFFGSEPFYFLFYPFCMWNFDFVFGRQVALLWALSLYFGGAFKDFLCSPRPHSPPVAKLELAFSEEFAMPSTHAMAGSAMAFTTSYLLVQHYNVPVIPAVVCGVLYPILIALSRLYLGVHSILDLVCGIFLSSLLCCLVFPFLPEIDWFLQTSIISPVFVVLLGYAMCYVFYPTPKINYNTRDDTVHTVIALGGFYLGSWINYQCGLTRTHYSRDQDSISNQIETWLFYSVVRVFVGMVVIILISSVVKEAIIRLMSWRLGFKKPTKEHPPIRAAYKHSIFVVCSVGFTSVVPYLFTLLGIGRPTFYSEIL